MRSRYLLHAAFLAMSLMTAAGCTNGGIDPAPIPPGAEDPSDPSNPGDGTSPLPTDAADPNNFKRDTDCDGLSDQVEFEAEYDGLKTHPGRADTDGDGLKDGFELGIHTPVSGTGCTLPQDASLQQNTSPVRADSDGDGLSDGQEDANRNGKVDDAETHPLLKDTDCDGLLDGPTRGGVKGEDQNINGQHEASETDPRRFDTDGDGISDGVELGVTANLDELNCKDIFRPDTNPSSITDPRNADSDGDGISDGAEDANQNGSMDYSELNPNDSRDATGPAAQVCTANNLRPVSFRSEEGPDIKLALPPSFQEVTPLQKDNKVVGLVGYDSTSKVAFLVYRTTPPTGATDPLGDEEALSPVISSKGTLSNRTSQSFKTWEGFSAVQAFYEQTGQSTDLKRRTDELVDALLPGSTGRLSAEAANVMGDFRLQTLFVHRSNQSLVVLIAVAPLVNVTGVNKGTPAAFFAKDLSDGSALAQFGEPTASQCELFQVQTAKVDFLLVVDDSCSMASSQTALAETAKAATEALNATSLDWRMAMVTSNYHVTGKDNSLKIRPFTRNVNKVKAWLTKDSVCTSGFCTKVAATPEAPLEACPGNDTQGANGGCWIGIGGNGSEGVLGGARRAINTMVPATAPGATESGLLLRQDASPVVILLGDADDQTSGNASVSANCGGSKETAGGNCENVQVFKRFFGDRSEFKPTNPLGKQILVHGIVCPSGQYCGCTSTNKPCDTTNDEREFNPQPINGVVQLRHTQVVNASGGVLGSIKDTASIRAAMDAIIDTAIGNGGYRTLKPPIGASIKVAVEQPKGAAVCTAIADVPRSTAHGFDFDGRARTLSIFGDCRPATSAAKVAVSYQYWVDTVKDPDGGIPCEDDPNYTPTEPDYCSGPLLGCDAAGTQCVCKPNCGSACGTGTRCNMTRCACDVILK